MNNNEVDFEQLPGDFPLQVAGAFGAVAVELNPACMTVGGRSVVGLSPLASVLRQGPSRPEVFRTAVIARPGDTVPANGFGHVRIFWNAADELYIQRPGKRAQRLITLAQLTSVCYDVAAGAGVQA